jgi:predicted small integral membrane protein
MSLEWMAWTPHTALFFLFIFLLLVGMLIWELVSPTIERRGFLFIPTTRGTRLFHRPAGQWLHPFGLAGDDGFVALVRAGHRAGLDGGCDALGMSNCLLRTLFQCPCFSKAEGSACSMLHLQMTTNHPAVCAGGDLFFTLPGDTAFPPGM